MSEPILDARSFWELLDRRVNATPDTPALLDADDRRLSFAELRDRAERAAAGFAAMGIGEGTPVTWELPTRIETVVASLGLSRLGAVQNPIIQIYRDREVGFCIRQTGAEFVLVPGTWGGYDYVEMVERVSAGLDTPPQVITAYDSLPDGDPTTQPPPAPPPGARPSSPKRWIKKN